MRVLLTRSRPRAENTARLLRRRGHNVMIDPIYDIVRIGVVCRPGPADAVILTSANAVPSLDESLLDRPVFAVGAATARAARRAGATDITVAGGDWRSLVEVAAGSKRLARGARFLHLAGEDTRGDLEQALTRAGYRYSRRVVYEARSRGGLSPRVVRALADRQIDAVLFFSPRAGRLWTTAVSRAGLDDRLQQVIAVCISEPVAQTLGASLFLEIAVARQRDHRALADCLDGAVR